MNDPGTPARSIATISIGVALAMCFTQASTPCFHETLYVTTRACSLALPILAVLRSYIPVLKGECPAFLRRRVSGVAVRFLDTVLMRLSLPISIRSIASFWTGHQMPLPAFQRRNSDRRAWPPPLMQLSPNRARRLSSPPRCRALP